jgi:hypothetical protein
MSDLDFHQFVRLYIGGYGRSVGAGLEVLPHLFCPLSSHALVSLTRVLERDMVFLGPYNFGSQWLYTESAQENFARSRLQATDQDMELFATRNRFIEYFGVLLPGTTKWTDIASNIGADFVAYDPKASLTRLTDLVSQAPWALCFLPNEPEVPLLLLVGSPQSFEVVQKCVSVLKTEGVSATFLGSKPAMRINPPP